MNICDDRVPHAVTIHVKVNDRRGSSALNVTLSWASGDFGPEDDEAASSALTDVEDRNR